MLFHDNPLVKGALLCALLSISMLGCSDGTHDFTIRFSDIHGLRNGDAVYHENAAIGTIENVAYTETGLFLVEVAIRKEFAPAATDASRFFIDADPENGTRQAVQVVQLGGGGTPIKEGAVVNGQTKYTVLYEQFAHQLGRNLAILESGINAFLRELQGVPESDQIRALEKQLDEIIAELGNMSREMKRRLEHDVLPLLKQKIEELRQRLEGTGREEDLESIDRKMDRIDRELSV